MQNMDWSGACVLPILWRYEADRYRLSGKLAAGAAGEAPKPAAAPAPAARGGGAKRGGKRR
jgi:hypothetical protein